MISFEFLIKERDRFVLWVPVLLATGIGWYFALDAEPPLWGAALAAGALAMLAFAVRRHLAARAAAFAALAVAVGFLVAGVRTHIVAGPVTYGQLFFRNVEGRVDDIDLREKGERLTLSNLVIERLSEQRTPQRVTVALKKPLPGLEIGDRVRVNAMLFSPPAPAYPGAFDFARMFYFNRIGAVGYAPRAPELIERAGRSGFEEGLNALRLSLLNRIGAPMQPENGAVAAALMVGEQAGVSEEINDAMRDAGIYHVLSISGLHMSLAVALLYVTLRLLLSLWPAMALRLPVKKIAAAMGLLGALAYLLLAGYPVPAVRSFVMVACVMLAVLFDRRGISLYSLAWAATLILLFHPESLLGASFQLSFAATLGILALYERFSPALFAPGAGLARRFTLYFFGLMATSLVATLMTTPLVIYHFNRFTLWGILANMLMVPLASFWIMPAAVLAFLAMPFGLEHWPLVWLDHGIALMVAGARWFATLPYASFAVPPPSFAGLMLVVFGGLWLCLWRRRWRLLGIPAVLLGMATVALHEPYDIMISDDGARVAVRRENGEFLFLRGRPTSFEGEVWLRVHGQDRGLTLSDLGENERPDCDRNRCIVEMQGRRIVVARRRLKDQASALCRQDADMVIAGDKLDEIACAKIPYVFDWNYLNQSGAVGIRITGGEIDIETANEFRGKRPWNGYK